MIAGFIIMLVALICYTIYFYRQERAKERIFKRWQALFHDPRSKRLLEKLVNEALAEDAFGETEEITGDHFLSV